MSATGWLVSLLVSELDHHLDGFTAIHRTIAIGDTVKLRDAIEHEARSIRPANTSGMSSCM